MMQLQTGKVNKSIAKFQMTKQRNKDKIRQDKTFNFVDSKEKFSKNMELNGKEIKNFSNDKYTGNLTGKLPKMMEYSKFYNF